MAKTATAKEKKYLNKVASMGCIVCCNLGLGETPAEIHHIGNGNMSKRASNYEVIPLCHFHHRTGGYGFAIHSGKKEWELKYGKEKDLLEQTRSWL